MAPTFETKPRSKILTLAKKAEIVFTKDTSLNTMLKTALKRMEMVVYLNLIFKLL